jgi:regulator of sigma E protease
MLTSIAFSAASFIVLISVIVVFHELGHYWVGRLLGTDIEAFSIGFGPKLLGWTDRLGTQWKICLLPLGGYVRFRGDANSASMPDREEIARLKAQMVAEGIDPRRIFQLKPLYQRFLIVLAGPIANFVLALVLFMGIFSIVGEPLQPVVIGKVSENTPAAAAGLQPDDQIIAIDGWKLYSPRDLFIQVATAPNERLTFTIQRGERTFDVDIRPAPRMITIGEQSRPMRGGQIGIQMKEPDKTEIYHHGPISAAMRGVHLSLLNIDRTFLYLKDVITGQTSAEQLSGPLGIAVAAGQAAKAGVGQFIFLIAFVSVGVGLVNLFPVPVLDGGHLLFYAIEAIQGRPLSHRLQEIGFRIGLALLVLLFAFVTWNDFHYHLPLPQRAAP